MWESLLVGATVAALNGLVAWWLAARFFFKGSKTFMIALIGGMGARLVLVLGVSVALLKFTSIRPLFYLAALIVVFFAIQVLESVYLLRRHQRSRELAQSPPPACED
jgi:hypothetical protein